MHNRFDLKEY